MKVRKWVAAIAATGGLALGMGAIATSAQAATPTGFACSSSDISIDVGTYLDCAGYFEGNLDNAASVDELKAILGGLGLADTDFLDTFDFDANKIEDEDATSVDFTGLSGVTYISLKFGQGRNSPGGLGGTGFYKIDFTGGEDIVSFDFGSFSHATVYSTGGNTGTSVPEPGAWALMILGFGSAGAMLRRRRTVLA